MPRRTPRPRPLLDRPLINQRGRTRRASRIASTFADHRCTDELSIIVDRLSE